MDIYYYSIEIVLKAKGEMVLVLVSACIMDTSTYPFCHPDPWSHQTHILNTIFDVVWCVLHKLIHIDQKKKNTCINIIFHIGKWLIWTKNCPNLHEFSTSPLLPFSSPRFLTVRCDFLSWSSVLSQFSCKFLPFTLVLIFFIFFMRIFLILGSIFIRFSNFFGEFYFGLGVILVYYAFGVYVRLWATSRTYFVNSSRL